MKRNPAGGAEVPQPGGYQEETKATFGVGTIRPHLHDFVAPPETTEEAGGKPIFGPEPRCRDCYMTKAEAKEAEHGRADD